MTVSNQNPVADYLLEVGDSFSFDLDDGGTTPTEVTITIEGAATEVAYTLTGGSQPGYSVSSVLNGNVYTFTVERTAGWDASPFTVNVSWIISGVVSTDSWNYELRTEQKYPSLMQPRNPVSQGTLIITDDGAAVETETGWIDLVGATVTSLGGGKVRASFAGGGGGVGTFTGLSDTPNSYTNTRGGVPQVNDGESSLEFVYGLPDLGQWRYLAPPSAVPSAGQICTNATILANINTISVHNDNWGGDTMRSALLEVEVGSKLYLRDEQLGEGGVYEVTLVTDNTTYVTYTVAAQTVDTGPFGASGSSMALTVLPGAAATGAGGSYGYGTWAYDAGATSGGGIAAGEFRLNNADPTSATILYIRKDNREGVNLGTILEDAGGYRLSFWNADGTEGFVCDLGVPSDLSAYWQFPISNVVGDTSLVDAATFGVTYIAPTVGAAGDVSGPAGATDNAVALFDGTTGKLIKNGSTLSVDGFGNLISTQEIQATGELQSDTGATVKEVVSHVTPAAGYVAVYAKADGLLYSKDDAGTETLVSGGAGGGGASDHGALTGLADDDHTQYVPTVGTRAQDAALFTDRADHVNVPATGFGELWLKDGAEQDLVFTDEVGGDREVVTRRAADTLGANYVVRTSSGSSAQVKADADLTYTSGSLNLIATSPLLTMGEHPTAPGTPSAGQVAVYAKVDGLLYSKDDAGVETLVSGGASAASNAQEVTIWTTAAESDLDNIAGTTPATAKFALDTGTSASITEIKVHESLPILNVAVDANNELISAIQVGDEIHIGSPISYVTATIDTIALASNVYTYGVTVLASSGTFIASTTNRVSFGRKAGGVDINSLASATVASGDLVLIEDISDSNNRKKVTAQAIADLGGGGGGSGTKTLSTNETVAVDATEVVIGGGYIDGSTGGTYSWNATWIYNDGGGAGTQDAELRLYNDAGLKVSTLLLDSSVVGLDTLTNTNQALTAGATPTLDGDIILNSTDIYEVRLYITATGAVDSVTVYSCEFVEA